jgi:hypothetical protein
MARAKTVNLSSLKLLFPLPIFGPRWSSRPRWCRYRVTPRANPAVFRRQLLRAIRSELRRIGELSGSIEPRATNL